MRKRHAPGFPIVLASASPRRKALLEEAGIGVEVAPTHIEEVEPEHLTGAETALLNARRKALAAVERFAGRTVLAADTVVDLDGVLFAKPTDMADADRMLSRLCGRTHLVHTGVWLQRDGRGKGFVETSAVTLRKLKPAERQRYLRKIGPLDKAGAYAAQDDAEGIIEKIEGLRSNVIGLPVERLIAS